MGAMQSSASGGELHRASNTSSSSTISTIRTDSLPSQLGHSQSDRNIQSLQDRVAAAAPPTGQPGRLTPLSVTAAAAAAARATSAQAAATSVIPFLSANVAPPAIMPLSFEEDSLVQVPPATSASQPVVQPPPSQEITRYSSNQSAGATSADAQAGLATPVQALARLHLLSSSSGLSEDNVVSPATPSIVPQSLHASSNLRVLLFETPQTFRSRILKDLPWLLLFLACLGVTAYACVRIGLARWKPASGASTHVYWPVFLTAAASALVVAWMLLHLLCLRTNGTIKVTVHLLTSYMAVLAVFCFWDKEFVVGVVFGTLAVLQFIYAMAVVDRLAFTMLVIRKAVRFVSLFPSLFAFAHAVALVLGVWTGLWSFGAAGVVALPISQLSRWWILLLLACSILWTGAVAANVVGVVAAGVVSSWLASASEGAAPLPSTVTLQMAARAQASLGSICYGSLLTWPISITRWAVRGIRARCLHNECCFCCITLLFSAMETLKRTFNGYGFVSLSARPTGFNRASIDAWELLQSTGMEAIVAYDLSGAVLLMGITLGALIAGTGAGVWIWYLDSEVVVMVTTTSIIMASALVGVSLMLVISAVAATYVVCAEDPSLIGAVDAEFAAQLLDMLHLRLQHRSGKPVVPNLASTGVPGGIPPV